MPDVETYKPEEYYDPIVHHSPKIKVDNPLSPYEELQKYKEHRRKNKNKADMVV